MPESKPRMKADARPEMAPLPARYDPGGYGAGQAGEGPPSGDATIPRVVPRSGDQSNPPPGSRSRCDSAQSRYGDRRSSVVSPVAGPAVDAHLREKGQAMRPTDSQPSRRRGLLHARGPRRTGGAGGAAGRRPATPSPPAAAFDASLDHRTRRYQLGRAGRDRHAARVCPAEAAAAFPLTLTDDEGTEVEIADEPDAIVSLTPAATETLFALGVGDRDRRQGRATSSSTRRGGRDPRRRVDGTAQVDVERIVDLEPDLVIAGGNFATPPADIERLRDLDIPVVVVYAPTIETVLDDIELLGHAVGKREEADAIVEEMQAGFDAVAASVADQPKPRVFYELDATGAFYGPADNSFLAEMIELAGAEPITTGSPTLRHPGRADDRRGPGGHPAGRRPFGVTPEQVAARPGWDVITAVKNGDIRPIDDQTVTRPGPRLVLGLPLLGLDHPPGRSAPSRRSDPPGA